MAGHLAPRGRSRTARLAAAAGSAVLVAGAVVGPAAPQAASTTATLDGLTVTGTIDAPPLAVWQTQVTPRGVCDLIPGCVEATGSTSTWLFAVTDGTAEHEVTARITRRAPGRSLRLAISARSPAGSIDGLLRLDLAAERGGARTRLALTIETIRATGLTAAVVPAIEGYLQQVMDHRTDRLDLMLRQVASRMRVTVRGRRTVTARAAVTTDALTAAPPTTAGTVGFYVGRRTRPACVGRLDPSGRASCRIRTGATTGTLRVTAVATGTLSDGSPLMAQARARWSR